MEKLKDIAFFSALFIFLCSLMFGPMVAGYLAYRAMFALLYPTTGSTQSFPDIANYSLAEVLMIPIFWLCVALFFSMKSLRKLERIPKKKKRPRHRQEISQLKKVILVCSAIVIGLIAIFFWSLRPHITVSRTGFEYVGWSTRWSADFAEVDRVDLNARVVSARWRYLEYHIVLYRGRQVILAQSSKPAFMAYIAAQLSADTDCFINLPRERRTKAFDAILTALSKQPQSIKACKVLTHAR